MTTQELEAIKTKIGNGFTADEGMDMLTDLLFALESARQDAIQEERERLFTLVGDFALENWIEERDKDGELPSADYVLQCLLNRIAFGLTGLTSKEKIITEAESIGFRKGIEAALKETEKEENEWSDDTAVNAIGGVQKRLSSLLEK